jgi:hypothetical protein
VSTSGTIATGEETMAEGFLMNGECGTMWNDGEDTSWKYCTDMLVNY